ncbi:MAG: hypothetical protein ABRQ25_06650 [Clostridiaceae bacterium]
MKVIFFHISWMKHYYTIGRDLSFNEEEEYGNDSTNFFNTNGKCYGFVMNDGSLNIEEHFDGITKEDEFINDVLVVWIATNDLNETKIVGWYKNAVVYRKDQSSPLFGSLDSDECYRTEAAAHDCFLLPEKDRTFLIERNYLTAEGKEFEVSRVLYGDYYYAKTKIVPEVIEYINNYEGEFVKIAYTDEDLYGTIEGSYSEEDFEFLKKRGKTLLADHELFYALKYFNTAKNIKEDPELLYYIGDIMLTIFCYNEAAEYLEKAYVLGSNNTHTVSRLVRVYEDTGNVEKVLKYCSKMINLLDDIEDNIFEKHLYSYIMFNAYVNKGQKKNAKAIIDEIASCSDSFAKYFVSEMKLILQEV